jgi:phosphoglycerol transferase MdoB-like AlkP superfamily enzyme
MARTRAERNRAVVGPLAGVLAVVLAPWAFRCLALWDEGLLPTAADAHGALADLSVGFLLLALLWPLARVARWLAALTIAVLAVGYYANFETILALATVASPFDVAFLTDPTFFQGSALAVAHPLLLAAVVLLSLLLAWPGLAARGWRAWLTAAGAGVLGLAVLAVWPEDDRFTIWRQENALAHNTRWLAFRGVGTPRTSDGFASPPEAMFDLLPTLRSDLDAPPRFEFEGKDRNVLLVVLESVSGNYLASTAAAHRRRLVNSLPNLERVVSGNLTYTSFFNHQRRTNRGLYALLCGEPPRLLPGMPKMTVAAGGGWQKCLPEILREAGYRTAYLQAAPLAFMLKDRFMPAIGFEEVYGHDWFQEHYVRAKWGVDDRAFLEQSLEMIETLEAGDRPWFLTLLTVGTHHPYVVPESFRSGRGKRRRRAFQYLDEAVGDFFRTIEASGIRDDTIVIITSDESAGDLGSAREGPAGRLTQNWGFLTVLLPEHIRDQVEAPYSQSDVALSVLDYLGLGAKGQHLFGRSLFRKYPSGRHLFFGNLNYRAIGGVTPEGVLLYCDFEGHRCQSYAAYDQRFFAAGLPKIESDPAFVDLVLEMATRSRPPVGDAPLAIPLLADPVFQVTLPEWQIVQGIVEVSLQPQEWLEVEFEVEARGEGSADLKHIVRFHRKRHMLSTLSTIEAGQTLRLRYTFASDLPVPHVNVHTMARVRDGWKLDLVFKKRRFLLRRHGERPESGIQIEAHALEPPGSNPNALSSKAAPASQYNDYLRHLAEINIDSAKEEVDEP